MLRGHTHRWVNRRWWSWAVRSASWTRVVLAATPAQADTRVSDWVALHLVDGHLGSVALNELDETAALSWWDLDIGNLAKALEEASEFILGDVARKTTNEDGGVVRVGELVHWLRSAVEAHWGSTHTVHANWTARHAHLAWATTGVLVLGSRSGNAHWAVAAVDTLHLLESALLIGLIGEAHESVTARQSADRVRHDLGGFARWEASLEDAHEDVLVDLWAEIANEDGVLWATVLTAAVCETTTGSPVQLEGAVRVRNDGTVELKGLSRGLGAFEIDEAVAGVGPRELITDHLHANLVAHTEPDRANEVLINPWLELTHPQSSLGISRLRAALRRTWGAWSRSLRELGLLGNALHRLAHRWLLWLCTSWRTTLLGSLLTLERVAVILEAHSEGCVLA